MHILSSLVLASATFSTLGAAIPLQKRNTFTVNQQPNTGYKKNGPAALAKALGKYNAPLPPVLAKAASDDGTVTATPDADDEEYLCPVSIGGQTLNLDFDTGSADLWVFSTELSKSAQTGHSIYNPAKSSTYKALSGATWSISYGDGSSASGDVGTDTVVVGGTTVTGQAVELAKKVSSQFTSDTSDGLLGLAFSSINTVKPTTQKTFFDNASPDLASPLFTADLKKGTAGSYDFGFIDETKYTGDISYVDVDSSQGFWEFTCGGYQVGDGTFNTQSIDAIADTGTTLLLTDDAIVKDYYSGVTGSKLDSTQGGYTFPCSATLPDFTFGVGSNMAVIGGDLINFAPTDSTGATCFGGIQSNSGLGMTIFGDIMFKAQFVIFDGGNTRLGFAAKS